MKKSMCLLGCALMFSVTAQAQAVPYYFEAITSNGIGSPEIGEAQLSVDVTDAGNDQVLFTFLNVGPDASSIADVYFEDSNPMTLLSLNSLIDADENGGDSGVDFSTGATPGNLPAGNTVGFMATAGFTADSDSPVQPNGVNPGESLGVLFDIVQGSSFAAVLNDLNTSGLRIGIHVQGFANGRSESFVNCLPTEPGCGEVPPQQTPEPGTIFLMGSGLAGLGFWRWKSKK